MDTTNATPTPAKVPPEDTVAPPALDVTNLTVSYRQKPVLRHVSLAVREGALAAVVGPNGAGKSTLLKAVMGLIQIDSGAIQVLGRPLADARSDLAYVPQTDNADWDFPVTVREVVLMGRYGHLGWIGWPTRADHDLVGECLETVGMAAFADRHIRQLSGGQQQRVYLARALAQKARVLFLDEPFAGVDARTEEAILDLMDSFAASGKTLIVVSHNLQTLERFSQVVLLNQQLIGSGPPREVLTPQNLRRTYGGRMSFVDEAERALREGVQNND